MQSDIKEWQQTNITKGDIQISWCKRKACT